jgi:ATP-dependent RNA helicase DDX23/PRP28
MESSVPVVIKFVSKAERERQKRDEAQKQMEERKRMEQDFKNRKRELLKAAITGVSADTIMEEKKSSPSDLSAEDLEMIKKRHLGGESIVSYRTTNNKGAANFDYDLAAEDTAAGVEESYIAAPFSDQKDDMKRLAGSSSSITHWQQKLTSEMTERDWKIFREDFQIYVSGKEIPVPFRSWSESRLPRALLDAVHRAGYTKPTPIQMQGIPIAMVPRDMVGISSTGSGKTAAFVLPMLFYIQQKPPITLATAGDGPYALVMAPSRELALQIEQEAQKFSAFCKVRVCSIVGGRSAEQQTLTLSQGVELIVATPGRLADSLDAKQTVLNQCFFVVLDEADKMIDMSMEPFIGRILEAIPPNRVTQMFSATMPPAVERLTRKYLSNPITVTVGDFAGGAAKTDIQQRLEFVSTEAEKRKRLYDVVQETEAPIIVFVNSKRSADQVGTQLDNAGYRVMVLHSGKMQQKREDAIAQFKSGSAEILVATDVAGRGIDVPDVKHVINFDMSTNIEDYTHRIGRTGRAGKSGLATSFILPYDEEVLPELKKFLKAAKQFIPEQLERVSTMDYDEGRGGKRHRDGPVYAV